MKNKCNKVKKITLSFVIALLYILPFSAQASDVSRVNIKELGLNSASFSGGEVVGGNFAIENNFEEAVDLDYEIILLQGGKVFDKEIFQINEQVYPGKSISQEFEHKLPINIRSGEYILKVQLYSKNGDALNWEEEGIKIEGNNFYVNITNSYIVKDGKRLDAKEVPEYYAKDVPQIEVDVYNPNEIAMILVPKVNLRLPNSLKTEQEQFFASKVKLLPKKNEKLKIDMPKFIKQGVYVAELELLCEGKNISSIERFNWKIVNKEARILSIKTRNGLYYPGRENKLIVGIEENLAAGETKNAELIIEIKDKPFGILEKQDKEIGIRSGRVEEEIVSNVLADAKTLDVSAIIKASGKILDSYDGKLDVKIEKTGSGKKENRAISIIMAILLIFAAMAFLARKNFNNIKRFMENKLNI